MNTDTNEQQPSANESAESFSLGGNIELSGFKDLQPGAMTIIKKIVGSYTQRYAEIVHDFERVHITLKPIHKTGDVVHMFHINAKLLHGGKGVHAEAEDRIVFTALDLALKRIDAELTHHMHKH